MRGGETAGMLVRRKLPLFCCSIQSSLSLLRKRQRNHALRRKVAFTKPIGGTKRGGDSLLFSDREKQCCVTFVLHWIPHGHFNASSRRMKRQRVEKEEEEEKRETASSWNCSHRLKQRCTWYSYSIYKQGLPPYQFITV